MHCGGLRRVSVCVFLEMGLFKLSLIVVVNFMGGVMIRLLVRVVLPLGAAILGICGGLDGDFVEAQVRRRVFAVTVGRVRGECRRRLGGRGPPSVFYPACSVLTAPFRRLRAHWAGRR